MFHHLFTREVQPVKVVLNPEDSYLVPNKVKENGNVVKGHCSYSVINNADQLKQFSSYDFDIANIEEVGAYSLLKPTYLSQLSSMAFADKFQNITITENV